MVKMVNFVEEILLHSKKKELLNKFTLFRTTVSSGTPASGDGQAVEVPACAHGRK